MPISGVVITCRPEEKNQARQALAAIEGVEIHGDDAQGHIVAVLETVSSEAMQALVDRIAGVEQILSVGLTYINTEDEALRMAEGEPQAEKPIGFRK